MDVTIWTAFDRDPIYLHGVPRKSANLFAKMLNDGESELAWIKSINGWHCVKREHVVRAYFSGSVEANYGDAS